MIKSSQLFLKELFTDRTLGDFKKIENKVSEIMTQKIQIVASSAKINAFS